MCQPTLPVVAPQPRSVQVAAPVSKIVIRPPVSTMCQPTLPVVVPQPRSVQVAAPVPSVIFSTPVSIECQPTLPVVASQPRSVQVAAPVPSIILSSPVRSFAEVVSGKPPTCQQNFNERMNTWGLLEARPTASIPLTVSAQQQVST